ncbi:uncharacterized protein BKA55DRAFT_687595 [Fusarium redolens]|uniref:Uncharacterized protein n=1 Tax=Fusarium redolens TaxID=48865 RepID=A0A9P9HME7_FUSRE|nr:uncharacterized protein BKA55DRAFT_687595 [Fusarium redolens]KAH7259297.1 hypothetical protein BKA55DRAFT_687595 [Fusarium redolens]
MPKTSRSKDESSSIWVEGDFVWMIEMLPFYLDFSSMHACMLMTYLVDFLKARDPFKQSWVKANAVPCLDALPELIADEAVYIAQHKSRYFNYYDTFFKQKASLEELRIRIEKDEKRELKILAKEQRKLKARIDAQAGPSSQNKHMNKRGSLRAPSMIGDS